MDVVQAVGGYVSKMVAAGDGDSTAAANAKMKILLLDNFSNTVKKSSLERLAQSDDHETVQAVREYFADFSVINPDLMSLSLTSPLYRVYGTSPELWHPDSHTRSTEGLSALLLSLKKKPLIRYAKDSLLCKKLATELRYHMTQEEALFDFRRVDTPPILLLLDRREDPLTPLLTQWTYQAMVHELLGISSGRVSLKDVPDIRPELREIVLSQDQDPFFAKNMYANFGDLGENAKEYVAQFASKSNSSHTLESVADMKRFVEEYPEFRKLSGNVSKHVTLVSELSRRVEHDKLLDCSELEQTLACSDNHNAALRSLQQLLANPGVPDHNKLRLVAIYALRYSNNSNNQLPMLKDLLKASTNLSAADTILIPYLLAYARSLTAQTTGSGAGAAQGPLPDLFSQPQALLNGARSRIQKGIKGVENVYTQHSPVLLSTLESLFKGRLSQQICPFLDGQNIGSASREKPQDVIVFMVGGTTYEEARTVAQVNASMPGVRVVLGGTTVLRSESFFEQVRGAIEGWPDVMREVVRKEQGAEGRLRGELGRS
ncbi:MAG: hypothetical protein Q9159_001976 [Coniocarpon cinnabarinum]